MNSEQVNIYMEGTVAGFMLTSQNSPPWGRVLLEELMFAQECKEFPAF
jgi:hypothetical protein